jgi:DNA-binding NarL/FixJ family response regulator
VKESFRWKVLLVEDEKFTRNLITHTLEKSGIEVQPCPSVDLALNLMQEFEPHVVITELDLGQGLSGLDLLEQVAEQTPWVGMAVLSAHASPALAIGDSHRIPAGTKYVVKSEIANADDLVAMVKSTVEPDVNRSSDVANGKVVISQAHGDILRLMAKGLSNIGIAKDRGISVRAAEAMVQRTFLALGVRSDPDSNARVLAVRMWQQGKVIIR